MQKIARNLLDEELSIEVIADKGSMLRWKRIRNFEILTVKKITPILMFGSGRANQFGCLRTVFLKTF